ncbi:DUF4267 domain-containing protein [Bradyrhizobium manausense]|uniref:DUF4267 domain-containing protein n=1 Tax=Bradyrhizobium manausense TaxID=989370 RepID=A0A0R3D0Y6_9BRAD|nr:DUF4267 domain-containing protein [Bradyrhizobium manausense]KRQ01042.1 hypothetical protein AOQ71_39365 [Bradyrhizobium manausense]
MYWFSIAVALLAALGIIAIGLMYLANPQRATQSFGLPLPEQGPNVAWWLRLKGVRDVVSGLVVLALMAWGGPRMVGLVLLIEAIIPVGDMSLIFAARGSAARALGVHGLTAALMIAAAIALIASAA